MAQPAQPSLQSETGVDAFTGLVLRYLDGHASAEDNLQLKGLLAAASYRELFVQICRLHGNLHEAFAARAAKRQAARTADARADTIADVLSPDDTAHPAPKEQKS